VADHISKDSLFKDLKLRIEKENQDPGAVLATKFTVSLLRDLQNEEFINFFTFLHPTLLKVRHFS